MMKSRGIYNIIDRYFISRREVFARLMRHYKIYIVALWIVLGTWLIWIHIDMTRFPSSNDDKYICIFCAIDKLIFGKMTIHQKID